jgi:hypothetical protein
LENPNGIQAISPGLRGPRYPGFIAPAVLNPERVAAPPVTLGCNPVGIVSRRPVSRALCLARFHLCFICGLKLFSKSLLGFSNWRDARATPKKRGGEFLRRLSCFNFSMLHG